MMKAEVKSTKMLKELFIGNLTSLWEVSGSPVDGRGGLLLQRFWRRGMMLVRYGQL